jgi:hypothetical protein
MSRGDVGGTDIYLRELLLAMVKDNPELSVTEKLLMHVNLLGAKSCCDEGNRCAEMFLDYHRKHGIKIKIARN